MADVAEEVQDWENLFVIRFPELTARRVAMMIRQGTREDLAISIGADLRSAQVRFAERLISARVHDLPCVLEVYKTVDRKNFYKVADISQMILCSNEPPSEQPVAQASAIKPRKDRLTHFPHGLTPPMKSVRKRRFRKTKKKKYMDAPEVERELKRLLRSDLEASSVRWEVVSPEEFRPPSTASTAVETVFSARMSSPEEEVNEQSR